MGATGIQLGVDAAASKTLEQLARSGRAWVVGDAGSGRHTLAGKLADALDNQVARIDLLDVDEPDAAIGGLYGAAAWLPERVRTDCFRDWSSLQSGVRKLEEAAGDKLTLVVQVPPSWEARTEPESDWDRESLKRARSLLHALASSKLRVVWMTSRGATPDQLDESLDVPIPLPRPSNTQAILVSVEWGSYRPYAERLRDHLDEDAEPSPLALRLAVGLLALGGAVEAVVKSFTSSTTETLRLLTEDLAARLVREDLRPCRLAVARLLLARRPLSRQAILEVTQIPDEHRELVTNCVAYGTTEAVRMSPSVRRRLLGPWVRDMPAEELEHTHSALAAQFSKLDGAPQISATSGETTVAWLERQHHLARSARTFDDVDLPCRELYWARGRHLSIVRKAYAEAARAYEACVGKFPDDGYAWHYLGFNLERAGLDRKRARLAYEKAIEIEPANPWFNSRRVTFLLGQGKTDSAKQAWAVAIDNIDPDGERVIRDPWLPDHLHSWVAKGWLEVGGVPEAFAILRSIPEGTIERSERLRALRERILDAAEADSLGEAVYPRAIPFKERWTRPRCLPESVDGAKLERWFPGRVVRSPRSDVMRIVYGLRLEGGRYESNVMDVSRGDWSRWAPNISWSSPSGFVELGVYRDRSAPESDIRRIVSAGADEVILDNELPFAYLDRWRTPA